MKNLALAAKRSSSTSRMPRRGRFSSPRLFSLVFLFLFVVLFGARKAEATPVKVRATVTASSPALDNRPIVLDTVVATVDEKPITLRDLQQRLSPPRRLTLETAAHDQEALATLDRMIFEQTIISEAETKKISVDDNEVTRYMNEVAKKNNLTVEQLTHALQEQNKDVTEYRREIKMDILRSRLGSNYLQSSSAVTKEEMNAYLESHPELKDAGSQVRLSRIVIFTDTRSEEEAKQRAEEALKQIQSGQSFASVAQSMSDGAEAKDGGSLGLVAEKDLSQDIFSAVAKLNKGEVSQVVPANGGVQILKLDDRLGNGDVANGEAGNDALMADIRLRLQEDKSQNKIQSFFTSELFKNHTIEKKL